MSFWLRGLFTLVAVCTLCASRAGALQAAAQPPLRVADIFAREPLTGRVPASIRLSTGRKPLPIYLARHTLPGGEAGPLDTHFYDLRTRRDRIFFRVCGKDG